MIKITNARHREAFIVELCFSDDTMGEYDLDPIVQRDTVLTPPLTDPDYFAPNPQPAPHATKPIPPPHDALPLHPAL